MQQDLPTRRDLLVRLEARISETRRALVDAATAAGLQPEQEAAYQRLLAAVDELLARIRTAIEKAPASTPALESSGPGANQF